MAKTVLIVEDERAIVEILKFNLKREGYETLEALDGETGLLLAQTKDPDLILLDVMLPKMNGFDVCRTLRQEGDNVPVIILTAYDWSDIEEEARAAGVTAFCSKPMFMSDLRQTLLSMIRQEKIPNGSLLPQGSADFSGKKILLAEDNELNSEIATEILQEYGFLSALPLHSGHLYLPTKERAVPRSACQLLFFFQNAAV